MYIWIEGGEAGRVKGTQRIQAKRKKRILRSDGALNECRREWEELVTLSLDGVGVSQEMRHWKGRVRWGRFV